MYKIIRKLLIKILSKKRIYIIIFILAQLPIVYYLAQRSEKKERDFVNLHINQFYTQYKSILNSYKLLSQQAYDDSINKEEVLNIATKAYLPKNQKKLSQILKPIYTKLKKRGFSTLEFYSKNDTPSVSFKDYKQETSSKKVSKKYSTKIKINKNFAGVVYSIPIVYKRRYIGNVEFGVSFKNIKKDIQKLFSSRYEFVFHKYYLQNIGSELIQESGVKDYYFIKSLNSIRSDKETDSIVNNDKRIKEVNQDIRGGFIGQNKFGYINRDGAHMLLTAINLDEDSFKQYKNYLFIYSTSAHTYFYFDHFKRNVIVVDSGLLILLILIYINIHRIILIEKLKRHKDELEEMVKKRTKELQSSLNDAKNQRNKL